MSFWDFSFVYEKFCALRANWNLDFPRSYFANAGRRLPAQWSPQLHANKREYPRIVFFCVISTKIGRRVPLTFEGEAGLVKKSTKTWRVVFFPAVRIFVCVSAQRFKRMLFHLKLPQGEMFSRVKLSDIANSKLNLAETKFCEVGLAPPCLLWVLQTLNLARYLAIPRVIAWCLALHTRWSPRQSRSFLREYYCFEPPQAAVFARGVA